MKKDPHPYSVLIIEDNPGDYVLILDYLEEQFLQIQAKHASSFAEAKKELTSEYKVYDIILLDLTLPDKSGTQLIHEIKAISDKTPVVVLTGYSDLNFAVKSLSAGASDYLLKDELSSAVLYKTILYNLERHKYISAIRHSEEKYSSLFKMSPIPMWVYDAETLQFLDVNEAAIKHYGYSRKKFLSMSIMDIRPKDDIPSLKKILNLNSGELDLFFHGVYRHVLSTGKIIDVEIQSNSIKFNNREAKIILASDITDRLQHLKTIEQQNTKLKEIAWYQSHVVRAPLARMMGIIKVLDQDNLSGDEKKKYLKHALNSAFELDDIIRDVVDKSQAINIKN